jgi:CheY-like chemotaxis protein
VSSQANRSVLIVEDDIDAREFLRTYLGHAGYETRSAANGREGLQQLCDHRPLLVLLDLSMPVMNGWEFRIAQQALADRDLADVPVVVTSALSDCAEHAATLGAIAVLPKPIDFDRLLHIVGSVAATFDS